MHLDIINIYGMEGVEKKLGCTTRIEWLDNQHCPNIVLDYKRREEFAEFAVLACPILPVNWPKVSCISYNSCRVIFQMPNLATMAVLVEFSV
jgi:hypothetical protein